MNAPTSDCLMPSGSAMIVTMATAATKAASKPYSMRSSPFSSRTKLRITFIIFDLLLCRGTDCSGSHAGVDVHGRRPCDDLFALAVIGPALHCDLARVAFPVAGADTDHARGRPFPE